MQSLQTVSFLTLTIFVLKNLNNIEHLTKFVVLSPQSVAFFSGRVSDFGHLAMASVLHCISSMKANIIDITQHKAAKLRMLYRALTEKALERKMRKQTMKLFEAYYSTQRGSK